jgi:hypothetical protein
MAWNHSLSLCARRNSPGRLRRRSRSHGNPALWGVARWTPTSKCRNHAKAAVLDSRADLPLIVERAAQRGGLWRTPIAHRGPLDRARGSPSRGRRPPLRTDSTSGQCELSEFATTKSHLPGFVRPPPSGARAFEELVGTPGAAPSMHQVGNATRGSRVPVRPSGQCWRCYCRPRVPFPSSEFMDLRSR